MSFYNRCLSGRGSLNDDCLSRIMIFIPSKSLFGVRRSIMKLREVVRLPQGRDIKALLPQACIVRVTPPHRELDTLPLSRPPPFPHALCSSTMFYFIYFFPGLRCRRWWRRCSPTTRRAWVSSTKTVSPPMTRAPTPNRVSTTSFWANPLSNLRTKVTGAYFVKHEL